MAWIGVVVAAAIILVVLIDTFEAMILPRRIRHAYRLSRLFYRSSWLLWRTLALRLPAGPHRNGFLSVFGPLSLFGLFTVWATGLIGGFALLHWSLGMALSFARDADTGFATYMYFSGTTFFTLGYGDIVPTGAFGRALSVIEAGVGFGFLAIVISYLPVLYQAFSRREITISLLDARAGSPPSAGELLRRFADAGSLQNLGPMLIEWERWSAELLESHLSYPVLRFYRSQHDNQSWVAALTTILDACAVLIAGVDGTDGHQARLTFAMARHAAVDLGLISNIAPQPLEVNRLPEGELCKLHHKLCVAGIKLRAESDTTESLAELRALYEPFVNGLANHLLFALPPFLPPNTPVDNWQTSPWTKQTPDLAKLSALRGSEDHFD